jgi:hypothetical protein
MTTRANRQLPGPVSHRLDTQPCRLQRKLDLAGREVKVRGKPGVNLQLIVDFHQGRKHPPIVTLKRVA